jgi:hypothetical protein
MEQATTAYLRKDLASGLAAVAVRMEPTEAVRVCTAAAATLRQALTQETNPHYRGALAEGLAAVAARMEPREAAATCGEVAALLIQALEQETNPHGRPALAQALAALADRLEPPDGRRVCRAAADILSRVLTQQTDRSARWAIARGLERLTHGMDPARAPAMTATLIEAIAREPVDTWQKKLGTVITSVLTDEPGWDRARAVTLLTAAVGHGNRLPGALAVATLAVEPLACRLSTQEVVELLKHPLCVGVARRALLDQLEHRYHESFVDQWSFVRFAEDQKLGLDFISPPRTLVDPAAVTR